MGQGASGPLNYDNILEKLRGRPLTAELLKDAMEDYTAHQEAPPKPTVGAGWEELTDDENEETGEKGTGKTYYYCHWTEESVWERPKPGDDCVSSRGAAAREKELAKREQEKAQAAARASEEALKAAKAKAEEILSNKTPGHGNLPEGGLPEGWEQELDQNTQRAYYWCPETNQTIWEVPTEKCEKGASKPLAQGWQETKTEDGKPYYWCPATNKTVWDKPELGKDENCEEDLPAGWKSAYDETQRKNYYYCENGGETRWDKPSSECK